MKKLLSKLVFLLVLNVSAQVGIGTTTPDASSILELESTTQGMLTPRMLQAERDAITSPATGLLIYQTNNTPGFYYYNGSIWTPFGGADTDWTVSGNNMYNANTGNVGVGNTAPTAKFHITGTASGGSGGTNTILSQDFESSTLGFVTGTVSANEYQITAPGGTEVWRVVDASTDYVTIKCASCTGQWIELEYESVNQDETFVSSQFTPSATATSLDITFDYRYEEFLGSPDESLSAYLYNDTDGAIASTLFSHNDVGTQNLSYSGSFTFSGGNAATDNYTLRFRYTGNDDYGASVDNIVVTESTAAAPGSSVFRLEDGTQQAGYVLTTDANGNATWQASSGGGSGDQSLSILGDQLTISGGNTVTIPTGGGGGGTYSFVNGITEGGGTVRLGGDLTQATYITMGSHDFYFEGTGSGDITFEDNNGQPQMQTNFAEGYTNFGSGGAFVDADNGQTFSDTYGGGPFTKEFVLGAYDGASGGTSIALGSIEYVVDGTSELFYEGGAFSPMDDFGADLGVDPFSGTIRRWDDVNADDFITPTNTYSRTSGRLSSTKDIVKGLSEIMKLKPIVYKDNMEYVNGKRIPEALKEDKLGFYTKELLEVIPEAVKKTDWVYLDESGVRTRVVYPKPSGIKFNQIIPVTVKAIQEQQELIKDLESEVSELKKLVHILMSERK